MAKTKTVVGVIGSGQMGSGIAQLAAVHGSDVYLLDSDPAALSRATKNITDSLARFVSKSHLSQVIHPSHPSSSLLLCFQSFLLPFLLNYLTIVAVQVAADEAHRRLKYTQKLDDLCDADFVIEAIVESEDVKKKLFSQLDKIVKASCILASNTSSISITRIASATTRPHKVYTLTIRFHFFIAFVDLYCHKKSLIDTLSLS